MKRVALPSSEQVPALGMGTWHMGESRAKRAEEIATLRLGLDPGLTLIDTAEMYGEGKSEELVGEAIEGRPRKVFLVTKVYPHNASRRGTAAACERGLRRLRVDHDRSDRKDRSYIAAGKDRNFHLRIRSFSAFPNGVLPPRSGSR